MIEQLDNIDKLLLVRIFRREKHRGGRLASDGLGLRLNEALDRLTNMEAKGLVVWDEMGHGPLFWVLTREGRKLL